MSANLCALHYYIYLILNNSLFDSNKKIIHRHAAISPQVFNLISQEWAQQTRETSS